MSVGGRYDRHWPDVSRARVTARQHQPSNGKSPKRGAKAPFRKGMSCLEPDRMRRRMGQPLAAIASAQRRDQRRKVGSQWVELKGAWG